MSPLDIMRIEVELGNVTAARKTLQLRTLELQEEIKRLENHVKVSIDKEAELSQKLDDAKKQ